ncbi:hypothetical protein HBE96_11235 [Clostridium sp. P21]|uniref:Uncharacterized protein n=1 Tax=Clostridium muellerianum TaxID=2716538 RepID=A0A7Y0HPQ2_9CLOT|nr:hypothetical protein [Clostridium muellerianum]NMM63241.1 hypothetical protein [Clostridium muellerianum]
MKYIGPFLRINKLKKENIEHQLFFLAKESLNQIVLYSKCGVYTPIKELKIKNLSSSDINTFGNISPLLCLYKKANPKLINIDNNLCWDDEGFKKEVNIGSNALMTLSILELCNYYKRFEGVNTKKFNLAKLYMGICKNQLEFYASHFRNEDGVFVDKKETKNSSNGEVNFEEKNKKFKFSSQALLMNAYYIYSSLSDDEEKTFYENFALDILNMLVEFKEDIYLLSHEEILKLTLCLNIFYSYSKNKKCKVLLLDLCELLSDKINDTAAISDDNKLEYDYLKYINYFLLYKNMSIIKFKEDAEKIYNKLLNLYDPEKGIFIKHTEKKDITFSCTEISLYLLVCLIHGNMSKEQDDTNLIILDIFKRQLVDSGIILSWPDVPNLNDIERYNNYTLKSEDLIDEQFFRTPSIPTPESCELAPIFIKHVTYSKRKETFKPSKVSFDSYKNMFIFFLIIYILKP